jgi:hypothetical protein
MTTTTLRRRLGAAELEAFARGWYDETHEGDNVRKCCVAVLLLSAVLRAALAAPSNQEPALWINCTQSGEYDGIRYQTTGTAVLRLCTMWQGQAGGLASTELYKLRRSVKGLRVGETLQFYATELSGDGSDSKGYRAVMVSTGEGAASTTVTGRASPTSPLQTWTFEDKVSGSLPPSAYPRAEIRRTASGAVLRLSDIYGPNNGGEGYFYSVCVDNAELTKAQREKMWTWQIGEAELDNWENLVKSQSDSAPGPSGKGKWSYSVTVSSRVPDLGEVAVEVEGYDDWIPDGNIDDETKPGKDIFVKAWVHKTGDPKTPVDQTATFTFELTQVGREKGVCANWPTTPGESAARSDLCISEDRNPDLEQVNLDLEAKTRRPVKEAKLVLSSFDYAAWGVLKVTARDKDGKPMKVEYLNKKDIDRITIPKDDDRNHIADAWQEKEGVEGLPAEWDEAEVKGQSAKGDGIPLFEKYRGFVVAEGGGKRYTRLKPREKAHFICDPQGIFDQDRWYSASQIRAYSIRSDWTRERLVDVNRGFGGGHGHWATLIQEDPTMNEAASAKQLAEMRGQWAMSIGDETKAFWTPKDVQACIVFSGRIRYTLRWLRAKMLKSLTNPQDADEREGAALLLTLGLSKENLIARLTKLSDAELDALVKPIVTWVAIHECAHCCGVNGHLGADGTESSDCPSPVPSCPMQYLDRKGKWILVLFGTLGGQGRLCDVEPHRCWRSLSPKD